MATLSGDAAFLILQRNIAQRSIGPSTVRGVGRSGVAASARPSVSTWEVWAHAALALAFDRLAAGDPTL